MGRSGPGRAPTVTGTLAQREGTGEYLLTPQNTPDGTAAGAAEVKAAAGVDGTVLNFWCNTNGTDRVPFI